VGHLVQGGGRTVYLSGDTDLFDGMRLLGTRGVDVAFLPVWGWGPTLGPGHLDPERAAEAVARIAPRIAVPVHWGTLAMAGSRVRGPLGGRMRRLLEEPPRHFADAVARRGLDTRVLITQPGQRVELDTAAGMS
jgi:L-ascorbate metabolism protein UlaG (beta-lactamase superfamily)